MKSSQPVAILSRLLGKTASAPSRISASKQSVSPDAREIATVSSASPATLILTGYYGGQTESTPCRQRQRSSVLCLNSCWLRPVAKRSWAFTREGRAAVGLSLAQD